MNTESIQPTQRPLGRALTEHRKRGLPRRRIGRLGRIGMRFRVLGELLRSFVRNGRYWLAPMVVVFVLAGLLLGLVQVLEYVAPFVYTMF